MAASKSIIFLGLSVLFCCLGIGFANEVLQNHNADSNIIGHNMPIRQDCCSFGGHCGSPGAPIGCVGASPCCGDYGNQCGSNGFGCPPQNPNIGCGIASGCCNTPPCQSCYAKINENFEALRESAQHAEQAISEEANPPSYEIRI